MRPLGSAYLVSPCSSAPFRWGRRSCLGLRTGVSPHFSMNSMREILALRGGYERGQVPLPSPMPPESGAPPHNTHPSMVSLRHLHRPYPLFVLARTISRSFSHMHVASDRPPFLIPVTIIFFLAIPLATDTPLYTTEVLPSTRYHQAPRDHPMIACDQ